MLATYGRRKPSDGAESFGGVICGGMGDEQLRVKVAWDGERVASAGDFSVICVSSLASLY